MAAKSDREGSDVLALGFASLDIGSGGDTFGRLLVVLHALLEGLDARGNFTHHAGNLPAAEK